MPAQATIVFACLEQTHGTAHLPDDDAVEVGHILAREAVDQHAGARKVHRVCWQQRLLLVPVFQELVADAAYRVSERQHVRASVAQPYSRCLEEILETA